MRGAAQGRVGLGVRAVGPGVAARQVRAGLDQRWKMTGGPRPSVGEKEEKKKKEREGLLGRFGPEGKKKEGKGKLRAGGGEKRNGPAA